MFCTKCGSKNADGAAFCINCGNNLQSAGAYQQPQVQYSQGYYPPQTSPYAPYKPQRNNKGLMIGLIIGGVVLVAGIILLIVLLTGKPAGDSILGMWYEETGYGGTLNFNSNGTVDISAMGVSLPADYTFDQKSGEGEINIYGTSTSFYLEGGELYMQGASYTRDVVEQQSMDLSDYGLSDYNLPDLDLSDFGY